MKDIVGLEDRSAFGIMACDDSADRCVELCGRHGEF